VFPADIFYFMRMGVSTQNSRTVYLLERGLQMGKSKKMTLAKLVPQATKKLSVKELVMLVGYVEGMNASKSIMKETLQRK